MSLTSGTKLGPYEIQSPLGAGGMGEVYRARDTRLDRSVAIKILPAAFSSDIDRLQRFQQEARILSSLNHHNLIAIFDVGSQNGSHYLVSELLEGATLRERLSAGPLPLRKAMDYGVQMANGLAAAHEKGIVHRDLKPDNVFITKDGRVKPTVKELSTSSERILPFVGNVASEDSAKRVVGLALERFGKLDILINNAATIKYTPVLDLSLEEWNSILAVNLTGAFLHSREAVRAMTPKKSGAIVNIGSYACFFGFPQIGAYAASKGGLAQLTRVLAVESIPHGIRVNAVGAGDVVTNLLNHFMPNGRDFLAQHGKNAPIGRAAQPEEIAEVAAFHDRQDAKDHSRY